MLILILEISSVLLISLDLYYANVSEINENFLPIVIVHMIVCFIVLIGNGYLIIFHIWLRYNGITTYEHIVSSRKKSKKSRQISQEPKSDGPRENCGTIVSSEANEILGKLKISKHNSMIYDLSMSLDSSDRKLNNTIDVVIRESM
jgi:hypothetical protein